MLSFPWPSVHEFCFGQLSAPSALMAPKRRAPKAAPTKAVSAKKAVAPRNPANLRQVHNAPSASDAALQPPSVKRRKEEGRRDKEAIVYRAIEPRPVGAGGGGGGSPSWLPKTHLWPTNFYLWGAKQIQPVPLHTQVIMNTFLELKNTTEERPSLLIHRRERAGVGNSWRSTQQDPACGRLKQATNSDSPVRAGSNGPSMSHKAAFVQFTASALHPHQGKHKHKQEHA